MNATSPRRGRRAVAATAAAILSLSTLGGVLATPALAHDGVDHGIEPALDWSNYEKITLTKDTGEPIDLAVLPDRRVLTTARNGDVRLVDPDTGVTKVVNTLPVYNNSEDGLQTVTLDPDFATNKWVYLYYAPKTMTAPYPTTTPSGSAPNSLPAGADASYWDQWKGYNQLSRFTWDDAADKIDLSTEQVIIKVETQRGQCCHVAGDVDFDADGNLYLSTGDNTPASAPGANGFAPNNNTPGFNPGFDSRRGAGNTNDLRGKILRIHPEAEGGYTIPPGNLFPEGTAKTRPEIFVMGVRNPFRIDVDPQANSVTWGDYGPDAGAPDPQRGPMGYVEWQTTAITKPINGGWPYCTADAKNYNEWDFATATPGPFFDCAAGAKNNSTLNTGLAVVPPATAATLYYGDNNTHQPWPELTDFSAAGGQGPMGGPVYHYDADSTSTTKFPAYWDSKAFFAEFSQDYLAVFDVQWPDGPVDHITNFLPNADLETNGQPITDSPIDIEFGPDGSLYVLDYGDGFFRANPDAGLYRIDYSPGNKAPQPKISANPISSSSAPLTVQFDGSDSVDPEAAALTFEWDFDGNGTFDATGAKTSFTYTELGRYPARLRVTDPEGRRGLTSTSISVGNVAPTVTIANPPSGAFFDWGQAVPFSVTTSDPEDGTATVCPRVSWTFGLGHDAHAHPLSQGTGCQFAIPTPADATQHGETENIFGVVVITYTDNGANGLPGATTTEQLVLNPKKQEAEWADATEGVELTNDDTASGLRKVTSFDAGDWLAWDPANLVGVTGVTTRASGSGTLSLRWSSPTATPFGTIAVDGAGWTNATATLSSKPAGTGRLYVTSTGGVVLDSLGFVGDGGADVTPPAVSATLNPAAPNGANGWYTSNVTVTVNATDNGTVASRQRSTDGGATWVNANTALTIATEGTTTVLYRATDNGGNVSEVGSVTVKRDTSQPAIAVSGATDGASVGDSGNVTWTATDGASGIDTVSARVDGAAVPADQPLALWKLTLGSHTLVVTAKDRAGLVRTTTTTFTTTTSLTELTKLTERLAREGLVTRSGETLLEKRLQQAAKNVAAGRKDAAISQLQEFVVLAKSAANVSDTTASAALQRDADAVIASLR
ncbi:PQQ-dependent sugar dehydrogenase [Terrabacter sp. MAHUQ-38]|uniref:PQQ-dependent sugar dehydrogenase n=1 Tax=unclassified Terrabacter TaxID=2630222 RepID=UPI00165E6AC8|nr:PQQ-dependent sugar dehydrogenase [Terrabacter sp. MAHUQ-38]MBC9820630.1 PQQ-dependent sugar dehydrogenase [Terrabacter sp. MAHUQ-38]